MPTSAPARGVPDVPTDIAREVPKGLGVHLILDNYATHKHPEVTRWLSKHKRFHLHPRRSSWLKQVERVWTTTAESILAKVQANPRHPRPSSHSIMRRTTSRTERGSGGCPHLAGCTGPGAVLRVNSSPRFIPPTVPAAFPPRTTTLIRMALILRA